MKRPLAAAALVLAAALQGCVSILPQGRPVQLYSFAPPPAEAAPASRDARVGRGAAVMGLILAQVGFPRPALGDAILTRRGSQAAYVEGARWVAPAAVLFQEAAEAALRTRPSHVALVGRGDLRAASVLLRLDVDSFEARYGNEGAAPVVTISLRATLERADGRTLVGHSFLVEVPASANRVSAIVSAFQAATTQVIDQVVDWTEAEAPDLAQGLDPASPTLVPPRRAVRGFDPADSPR